MNYHPQTPFKAPFVRCGFAAAAILMTFAVAAIIDGLARHYPGSADQLAHRPVIVTQR
jgi:hypothetical protein